jgi:hypothetical protein
MYVQHEAQAAAHKQSVLGVKGFTGEGQWGMSEDVKDSRIFFIP